MIIITLIKLTTLLQLVKLLPTSSKLAKSFSKICTKDQKPDYQSNLPTRNINHTRPEIERIEKAILDRVNQLIRRCLGLLHWTNTTDVINWFNGINYKRNVSLIQFDTVGFIHLLLL